MLKDTLLQVLNQLVPAILAVLAIIVVAEVQLFRRWFMTRIMPAIDTWYVVHTTAAERAALALLAREAVIIAMQELTKDPGADVLKIALAYVQAQLSRWGLSNLTVDAIIAAIKDAEIQLAKDQGRPVTSGLAI